MSLPRWLPPLLFLLAVTAAAWQAPTPTAPAFSRPPATAENRAPAAFAAAMLPTAAPSAHAATLAELSDGRLAAAWFAGTREGAGDVAIWFSTLDAGEWSRPRAIATRDGTAAATLGFVRKLGNPVLFDDGARLHLWFVSVAIGGWAGSMLNHSFSGDGGRTWAPPVRLQTSPFLNISTLVRAPPLPLADGGLGLPAYHEFIAKHGEWLRFSADGRIIDKVRMALDRRTLQPAVAALDERHALAVLRDGGPAPGRIRSATSDDGGRQWTAAETLPLPNPNASVALLRLRDGRLLIAGNGAANRNELLLWISDDAGKNWRPAPTVESAGDAAAEFSYPALLQTRDGKIHLAYTWRRQGIRHAVFNEAWLDGGAP
jgi:predicted neuraminidase